MTDDDGKLERELDRVLALASRPAVPPGAQLRLMAKLPRQHRGNVAPFAPRRQPLAAWPAAAALAASLALGIYLGTIGAGDALWPSAAEDEESVIGLGEAGDFFDGGST